MLRFPNPERGLPIEPEWPAAADRASVLLVDASSQLEYALVASWARRHAAGSYEIIPIPPSRRRRRLRRPDPRLEARLGRGDDPLVTPVRVAWFPPERDGTRSVRIVDLAKLGDPRDPDVARQHAILATAPDRCRIVVGESAGAGELRNAWRQAHETASLGDFVSRRAWLALERAERGLRGNRYKVPKFLKEEILRRGDFKDGVAKTATELHRTYESVHRQAARYLDEIAANHSPMFIDLVANLIHLLYRQGYGELDYDAGRLRELYALGADHPIVFLPAHRSQLDRLVVQFMLWENDLPPNHTAGGINLNFFPLGPLIRRTGVFFIRRTFKGKPVYKFALSTYIDYLLEKRFPLEWYLEGGRSRSGKLLPPRYGMLGYVADSYRRGKSGDVMLLPVSIAYDQIQDVGDYAREQRGEAKESESFAWLVKAIRSLRRRYGNVHIRFGEPVSMASVLDDEEDPALGVQKLAFEVMVRIGRATPITPTAVVALALLTGHRRPMTVEDITTSLTELAGDVRRRRLPRTERIRFDGKKQVREVLDRLVEHNIVTRAEKDGVDRYAIQDDQYLAAAYYRNMIVHFFVNSSITEMALMRLADEPAADPVPAFWAEVMRLRDLLKFEFFFAEKDAFRREIAGEISWAVPDWEEKLASGSMGPLRILEAIRPIHCHWALRPFLEAYLVVGDELDDLDGGGFDEKQFLARALDRGRRYLEQGIIDSPEAISQVLFKSALALAGNRHLLEDQTGDARAAFADEIRGALDRIERAARRTAIGSVA